MASTEDLRELWADAYDGWIGVPGSAPGSVVYLCPEETAAGDENDAAAPPHAPLPRVAQHSAMFALTGHNPMGETADAGANALANEELEEDLRALTAGRSYLGAHAPAPSFWWHSFGFSPQWREDGFVLCFAPAEADAARAAVLRLARKYRQGVLSPPRAQPSNIAVASRQPSASTSPCKVTTDPGRLIYFQTEPLTEPDHPRMSGAAYEYQWVSADASGGQARVLARKVQFLRFPIQLLRARSPLPIPPQLSPPLPYPAIPSLPLPDTQRASASR